MFFHAPHKVLYSCLLYLCHTWVTFWFPSVLRQGYKAQTTWSADRWHSLMGKTVVNHSPWTKVQSHVCIFLPESPVSAAFEFLPHCSQPPDTQNQFCDFALALYSLGAIEFSWLLQATSGYLFCGFDGMSEVYNISILRGRSSRDKATTYLQSCVKATQTRTI